MDYTSAVAGLDPRYHDLALKFLEAAAAAGLDPRVVQSRRSAEDQARLYAQGRTAPGPIVTYAKPGQSAHNGGFAIDVVPGALEGTKNWSPDSPLWTQLASIAKQNGIQWGGDWKMHDMPHFQLANWRNYEPQKAGTPAPAMPPAQEVRDQPVAAAQNAAPIPPNPAPATPPAEQKGGIGAVLASLAPAFASGMASGGGMGAPAAPIASFSSGDPMGATMAAAQMAQKARGLPSALMPDADALASLGKRPVTVG